MMKKLFILTGVLVFCFMTSVMGNEKTKEVFTNSIGMKFVRIEPGTFVMGQEQGGDWDEMPVQRVNITKGFAIAVTEVSNAQYEKFDPEHSRLRGRLGFSKQDDEDTLITFLMKTKDGEYAQVDIDSINYSRMPFETYLDYAQINYIFYYS